MIPTVTELELEKQAPGTIRRVWLALADDPLGLAQKVPVLIAKGGNTGKVVGITAALHGDEVNGIPVIHELFRKLDPTKLQGMVIGVPVVTVEAFRLHQRRLMEGVDLNHAFPGNPDGNFGQVYAHRFFDRVVQHLDILVDLHTASRGRANCLYVRADMSEPLTARMATLQRPQIILHNPPSDGTLRGAAAEHGISAITVEVGNPSRFQPQVVRRTTVGLRAVLHDLGMIAKGGVTIGDPPVFCTSSKWLYTDDGGLLQVHPKVATYVTEGEPIATLVDAFGDPLRTYTAPWDGIVIGRSVDPVAASGARILHLGAVAPEDHPLFREFRA